VGLAAELRAAGLGWAGANLPKLLICSSSSLLSLLSLPSALALYACSLPTARCHAHVSSPGSAIPLHLLPCIGFVPHLPPFLHFCMRSLPMPAGVPGPSQPLKTLHRFCTTCATVNNCAPQQPVLLVTYSAPQPGLCCLFTGSAQQPPLPRPCWLLTGLHKPRATRGGLLPPSRQSREAGCEVVGNTALRPGPRGARGATKVGVS